MNMTEAHELKAKYGESAFMLALDILEKQRAITFWTGKKNSADYYIKQNREKIKAIEKKLQEMLK